MSKTGLFSSTGSGLRQSDPIVVIYTKLCRLLDIVMIMHCIVIESKMQRDQVTKLAEHFRNPKMFWDEAANIFLAGIDS